jgi:hypothetical protein
MNYIMAQQRRKRDWEWPTVAQVRFIHSACSDYQPVDIPGETEKMRCSVADGPRVLKKFTAACIAASEHFTRYSEGSHELEEWTKLFDECQGLWLDVLKEGERWVDSRPWEECWRKEWIKEKRLGERWEKLFDNWEGKKELGEIKRGPEEGCVRSLLQHRRYSRGV